METPKSDGGRSLRRKLKTTKRTDWVALGLFLAYVIVFTTLLTLRQNGFHISALDFAKFDQAIWNTAHGRFYQISLIQESVIAGHFSPSLALYAPLYWIWANPRLLFFLQAVLLAATGGLIYWYLRRDAPWVGVAVFFAFLTHPVLHQVNFIGLRRLTLATVAVSFAFYHLLRRQYGWMLLGLLLALLSKEDLAIITLMFGLYLLLMHRQWKLGTAVTLVSLAWLIIIPFYVLPANNAGRARNSETYKHADFHYDYLGDSPQQMIATIITEPQKPLSYALQPDRVRKVWQLTWPTVFLFLLGPEIAVFLLPYLGFLLMSTSDSLGELQGWYPSILLPLLFWAMAVGLRRLPQRWRRAAAGILAITAVAGWFSYSQLWPGPKFNPGVHQMTAVDRAAETMLDEIVPDDVVVAAQDTIVSHLSHREQIYLYPWIDQGVTAEYIVLDPTRNLYPMVLEAYRSAFHNILAETEYEIAGQAGEMYVFRRVDTAVPAHRRDDSWPEAMTLTGYSVAAAPPDAPFREEWNEMPAGSRLRVSLYWDVAAGAALRVGLYNSATGERLTLADGAEFLLVPLAPDA